MLLFHLGDSYFFLNELMKIISSALNQVRPQSMARYVLTRFFLLSVISSLMDTDSYSKELMRKPSEIFETGMLPRLLAAIAEVVQSVIIDLNYEIEDMGDTYDYKKELKSPVKVKELRARLLRSFEKDVARAKTRTVSEILEDGDDR